MPEHPDTHVYRTYDRIMDSAREQAGSGRAGGWWPHRLDLTPLRRHRPADAGYAERFTSIDLDELARDIDEVLTTSQDWWPADFGHYGPLVLRMAWHSAGTYRTGDGRGGAGAGMLRFAPLDSWPDNRNLDKARRLLWPVKQKYGRRISWADLMIFAGNRALESMGFTTFGFGGGRPEVWGPDETYWGPERTWLAEERYRGLHELDEPLAASAMGLVYVDPQGPATNPDPVLAARDIRQTFRRMGLDDEETVALIAGGHTVGKTHGPVDPNVTGGPEPQAAPLSAQGLGWLGGHGTGAGADTVTSGQDGTWTRTPVTWDHTFFDTLFMSGWDIELSPAGQWQWVPSDGAGEGTVPDAVDPDVTHRPVMLTTDLALREDPAFEAISRRFLEEPDRFEDAFARAWFKLTHIDMGPVGRYLGALVPAEPLIWQDPVPEVDHDLVDAGDIAALKADILASGLTVAQLVATAWASASTYRDSDKRGGANGARIRLEPQCGWEVNDPAQLAVVLSALDAVQERFHASQTTGTRISMADLIVLGGCAAVERAAAAGGHEIAVPFRPGRTDATQEWTDVESFRVLRPRADGFRNHPGEDAGVPPEHLLVDRAGLLTLTAPEMTVLVGGLRVLGATHRGSPVGVLTPTPGVLTNDFFVHLLDGGTEWVPVPHGEAHPTVYEGRDRCTGAVRWTASRVDLVFGSSSELRALSEVYAGDDAGAMFVREFVAAWVKVMELDRFDPD
ncbi:hydroperoxidase [Pseudonocardia sp. EC080625-04]|uniref:catalase/peroxidase HPI n=1 Tax=unclassified Pseudonocardia TaxID=2619320 RepID=UPI0006CB70A6|nr:MULTISPECIES: catalase/peroxidase HPI [unclassified Pseudonocardia]ALE73779.1 hydroperoxidase [Pseudonocardia sp. EC080625-04]